MKRLITFSIFLTGILTGCQTGKQEVKPEDVENRRYDLAIKARTDFFATLQPQAEVASNPLTKEKVQLGHFLYYDKRLSKMGNISCNSCHNLSAFGVDNLPTSPGDAGMNGDRNSPTVLNAALHSVQFWDGRAKDVEQQAGMPVLNPVEMAIPNEKFLIDRISGVDIYQKMFKEAYPNDPNPFSYANLRNAIAAFERTLITPSRFDKYLSGDSSALTLDEKKGLLTFVGAGCTTCHNGDLIGGKMMQKFGKYDDYWKHTGSRKIDEGVFKVSGNENEKYFFKVPSLRNVEKTYPYFHDGSVKDLAQAIKIMGKVQLNTDLSDEQAASIVNFLKSLTSDVPEDAKKSPQEPGA